MLSAHGMRCVTKIPLAQFSFNARSVAARNRMSLGRCMIKVMGYSKHNKQVFFTNHTLPRSSALLLGHLEVGKNRSNAKRKTRLNKILFQHVTDLLTNGEYGDDIAQRDVEITKVEINGNFTILRVFWIPKCNAEDIKTEEVLNKCSGYLKRELCLLRVMGQVPEIRFIKDIHMAWLDELDRLMEIADYGEDHVPTPIGEKFKTELQLRTPLDGFIRDQIYKLDEDYIEDEEVYEIDIPEMPQTVFSMDYEKVERRIRYAVNCANNPDSVNCIYDGSLYENVNETPVGFESSTKQREAFREFLAKRQGIQRKLRKENKNYYPDRDYIRQMLEERYKSDVDQVQVLLSESDEYLSEMEV